VKDFERVEKDLTCKIILNNKSKGKRNIEKGVAEIYLNGVLGINLQLTVISTCD
jgi:hypothetical protein